MTNPVPAEPPASTPAAMPRPFPRFVELAQKERLGSLSRSDFAMLFDPKQTPFAQVRLL
jgi:hypothetical protein